MRKAIVIALSIMTSFPAYAAVRNGQFGLGVIVGEPTGPCFKYKINQRNAVDGAAAWSMANNSSLHLHADYLFHNYRLIKVEKGEMPIYFGIGGRIRFADGNGDDRVGIRIPVGLAYIFQDAPVDIFFEIVPILDLAPDTDLDFNGALGVRYFF